MTSGGHCLCQSLPLAGVQMFPSEKETAVRSCERHCRDHARSLCPAPQKPKPNLPNSALSSSVWVTLFNRFVVFQCGLVSSHSVWVGSICVGPGQFGPAPFGPGGIVQASPTWSALVWSGFVGHFGFNKFQGRCPFSHLLHLDRDWLLSIEGTSVIQSYIRQPFWSVAVHLFSIFQPV